MSRPHHNRNDLLRPSGVIRGVEADAGEAPDSAHLEWRVI